MISIDMVTPITHCAHLITNRITLFAGKPSTAKPRGPIFRPYPRKNVNSGASTVMLNSLFPLASAASVVANDYAVETK